MFSKLSTAKIFFSVLPSSHICPAKLPYLSCQASISVLPSTHFFPAKLTNFSSYAHGCVQELVTILGPQFKTTLRDASVVYNWKTGQPQLASYLVTCQILQHRINLVLKNPNLHYFLLQLSIELCLQKILQTIFIYLFLYIFILGLYIL